jgi:hypothetical protein
VCGRHDHLLQPGDGAVPLAVILSEADVFLSEAGVFLSEAGVILSEADVILSEAGVILSEADVILSEAKDLARRSRKPSCCKIFPAEVGRLDQSALLLSRPSLDLTLASHGRSAI